MSYSSLMHCLSARNARLPLFRSFFFPSDLPFLPVYRGWHRFLLLRSINLQRLEIIHRDLLLGCAEILPGVLFLFLEAWRHRVDGEAG